MSGFHQTTAGKLALQAELAKAQQQSGAKGQAQALKYADQKKVVSPAGHKPDGPKAQKHVEKWVQAALNVVLGIKLKVDGVLTGAARTALLRFQHENALPATGLIDERTLQALEKRVGLKAPREGEQHEMPAWFRNLARGKRSDKLQKPDKKKDPDVDGQAVVAQQAETAVENAQAPQRTLTPEAILQQEAIQSVATLAFERDFVEQQLERTQKTGDAALHNGMLTWFAQAQTAANAPWLAKVNDKARLEPDVAVAAIRAAWLKDNG